MPDGGPQVRYACNDSNRGVSQLTVTATEVSHTSTDGGPQVRYACKLRPHSFAVWNLFNRIVNTRLMMNL